MKRRLLQIDSAMRFVHVIHVILAVHVFYGLAGLAHFVQLKSMTPFELIGPTTGCSSTSIKVCYECVNRELKDTADLAELPQLFSFRVDCRGAKGDFQNMTIFDSSVVCAHLTYRKYGNSSVRNPTSQRLPLISDRIVMVEKGDVLDFQCTFRRLSIYSGLKPPKNTLAEYYTPSFGMVLDGGDGRKMHFTPLILQLFYLPGDREPCIQSLTEAYKWKMKVSKSQSLTYWVSFASPVLQPQILPEVEFSSELRGELYRLDKDLLHLTVMEATSYNSWKKPQAMAVEITNWSCCKVGHFWDGLWISLQ